jgi:hypothetical protein
MDGVKRVVYGLKKVSSYAVETEGGGVVRGPPSFPLGDCRGCSLLELTCEELEYPCEAIYEKCRKHAKGADCTDCEKLADCLSDKPCCWDCKHLVECLEIARERGGDEFVEDRFKCSWEEFVEAVEMLME